MLRPYTDLAKLLFFAYRFFRSGHSSLRRRHQARERRRIFHRDISEHFAVQFHARDFQSVNQVAVGDAVEPRRGADALNPQPAILPLLDAAIAKRVAIRSICGFLCGLVQLALCEEKAFGPLEVLLTPRTALCAAFYASHGFLLF